MYQNTAKCAHCKQIFVRITGKVPIVNRSDGKTFHLALYAGPSLSSGRTVCIFTYVHDRIGTHNEFVTVTIPFPIKNPRRTLRQVQKVADELAKIVKRGTKLYTSYAFGKGRLTPGFST